jgi:hypothetical protein
MRAILFATIFPATVPPIDPAFAPIVEVFASTPNVTYGKLMSSYGLKVNGKIFAMHGKGRLVVKLPKARVDALVASRKGKRFEPGPGRVMKEWISIAPGANWLDLAREAYDFAVSRHSG